MDRLLFTLQKKRHGDTSLALLVDGLAHEIEDGLLALDDAAAWADILGIVRERFGADRAAKVESAIHRYVMSSVSNYRFRIIERMESWTCQMMLFGSAEPLMENAARAQVACVCLC
jgi:hypothetical protein